MEGEGPAQTANDHQPGCLPGSEGRLCEERAQHPHRGVRGQEWAPVMTLPPSPLQTSAGSKSALQEICCAVFQPDGSGDERQHTQYLAFLLSHCCGSNWANRHPSVRLTAFLSSYWMQRDSWSATVTEWRLAWTVHCFPTMWR